MSIASSSSSSLLDWTKWEEPDISNLFCPDDGSYISFTFDVRQTLDLHRCDIDEETEEAITQFTLRKYVACFLKQQTHASPSSPYHRAGLRLLQQGLPDPLPDRCFDASMSIPVAPETVHPLNRPPVKTNRPLPWNGCYHPTRMDLTLRLVQCNYDYTDATQMDLGDFLLTDKYRWEDEQRMEVNLASKEGRSVRPPLTLQIRSSLHFSDVNGPKSFVSSHSDVATIHSEHSGACSFERDDHEDSIADSSDENEHPDGDAGSRASVYSDGASHTTSGSHASVEDFDDPHAQPVSFNEFLQCAGGIHNTDNDLRFTPVVIYSPDLSGIPFLYDIHQFNKDLKALEELVRKCREGPPMAPPTLKSASDPVSSHPELVTVTETQADDDVTDKSSRASESGLLTCLRKAKVALKTRVVKLLTSVLDKRRMDDGRQGSG